MTTDAPSFLSEAMQLRFAREVAKFPADQKQSAVMACLAIVQEEFGFVSQDSELAVADYLGMPPIAVHEVTTFYNMYNQKPVGKYHLQVCTNLSCMVNRAYDIYEHLCDRLDVKPGGTTKDGMFTVIDVECLGSCDTAPVVQINNDYHENMTVEKMDAWIRSKSS